MKKIKKIINLIIPQFFLNIYRLVKKIIKDLIKDIKLSKNYIKFSYNSKKALNILDNEITKSYFYNKLNKFHISYLKQNNIQKRRLSIILDNYDKYKLNDCCVVIFRNNELDFKNLDKNNLKNCLLICCSSISLIDNFRKIGLTKTIFLPLENNNDETDFDSCFDSLSDQCDYYFLRLMLYLEIIKFDTFYFYAKNLIHLSSNKICMSLPESIERRNQFKKINKYDGYYFFPCLVHRVGWIGCGLSYKMVALLFLNLNYSHFVICEDDAVFKKEYYEDINDIISFATKYSIDLVNGYPTDSENNYYKKDNYAIQTKNGFLMKRKSSTGAVLNIYSKNFLKLIASYNPKKYYILGSSKYQLDQVTKKRGIKLNVYVCIPTIVNHNLNVFSDIRKKYNYELKCQRNISIHELWLRYLIIKEEYEIRK